MLALIIGPINQLIDAKALHMKKFVKSFGIPVLETAATLTLAILTLVLSFWLRTVMQPAKVEKPPLETENPPLGTPIEPVPTVVETLLGNILSFDTPVPYYAIALVVALIGRIDAFRNRYKLGELQTLDSKLEASDLEKRKESQAHAESKSSYLETLGSALQYLLTTEGTGFDYRCRVTIYRRQKDDDDHLGQIFRHSPTLIYEQNGRIRIPVNEGVVGAAWCNHGVKEFEKDAAPNDEAFIEEMDQSLAVENCSTPTVELSMPSKHLYARAFTDHETGRRVGIVVYECTEIGVLKREGIDKVLDQEALSVSRLIRHLGVLHSEFNPVPGEEQL